jgi:hypothetical protein
VRTGAEWAAQQQEEDSRLESSATDIVWHLRKLKGHRNVSNHIPHHLFYTAGKGDDHMRDDALVRELYESMSPSCWVLCLPDLTL